MAQTQTDVTVDTTAPAHLWEAIADGVNTISARGEGVFVFEPDRFEVAIMDPANVALIRQRVDAEHFSHYDVDGTFQMGIDTDQLEDLLKIVEGLPVSFGWDSDTHKFAFHADDVEADVAGIDVDSVAGSPAEVPPPKDEFPYDVDVTMPVDKFERATKLVDMISEHATFIMGGDDGVFRIEGQGDTDTNRVTIHTDGRFEWREDPPDAERICRQANGYMSDVASLLDEETVRMVLGEELPYHLWTIREGVIDTKLMQAPRVSSQ